eukprot:133555-Pleurochrysis_carterae.AAC.1
MDFAKASRSWREVGALFSRAAASSACLHELAQALAEPGGGDDGVSRRERVVHLVELGGVGQPVM